MNNQEKNKRRLESLRPNLTKQMGTFLAYGSVPYISLQLCHECYTGVFAVWGSIYLDFTLVVNFFLYGKLSNLYANALMSQATRKGKIIIISSISE